MGSIRPITHAYKLTVVILACFGIRIWDQLKFFQFLTKLPSLPHIFARMSVELVKDNSLDACNVVIKHFCFE